MVRNTNPLFLWLKERESPILLFRLCIILPSKRAMVVLTVVFALEQADAAEQPMYVAYCDDIRDPIWSIASSLMQDMLQLSSALPASRSPMLAYPILMITNTWSASENKWKGVRFLMIMATSELHW